VDGEGEEGPVGGRESGGYLYTGMGLCCKWELGASEESMNMAQDKANRVHLEEAALRFKEKAMALDKEDEGKRSARSG
jgi:hypothetical protein